MMEVFYEKKDVFQLKELEKICPKEKGITPMSVKEILQSLVDDDMVRDAETNSVLTFYHRSTFHSMRSICVKCSIVFITYI